MDDHQDPRAFERRKFLKRAGVVAGSTVWAAPTIQTLASPAFATGTPAVGACPPENRVRFRYEVGRGCVGGRFARNDPTGPATQCLEEVDDYYGTANAVAANGCFGSACVQVALTCKNGQADAVTVRVTSGGKLLDVDAKAGGPNSVECGDATANSDGTFTADLDRGISWVAGVFCLEPTA